jgi:hypothetical protein
MDASLRSIEREIQTTHVSINSYRPILMNEEKARKFNATEIEKAKNSESLRSTKKISCGCCQFKFLSVNLPLKVSQKAISDIRLKWSNKLTSATVFNNSLPSRSLLPRVAKSPLRMQQYSAERGDYESFESETFESDFVVPAPRCYDETPVCIFCAQFFRHPEEYRPSFQKIIYDERKAAHMEKRRRELEYWDPLLMMEKFHAEEEESNQPHQQDSIASSTSRESVGNHIATVRNKESMHRISR